jgi:hypothetical protein
MPFVDISGELIEYSNFCTITLPVNIIQFIQEVSEYFGIDYLENEQRYRNFLGYSIDFFKGHEHH